MKKTKCSIKNQGTCGVIIPNDIVFSRLNPPVTLHVSKQKKRNPTYQHSKCKNLITLSTHAYPQTICVEYRKMTTVETTSPKHQRGALYFSSENGRSWVSAKYCKVEALVTLYYSDSHLSLFLYKFHTPSK